MPPKTKQHKVQFPIECCGVCRYSSMKGKQLYCWESPPVPVTEEGVPDFKRGFPVEPEDTICRLFQPRCHS